MWKWFKSRGFTDRLYFMNFVMVQIWTILSLLTLWMSTALMLNGTALATICKVIIVSVWSELGAHTGLIIWKAKAENQAKFAKQGTSINIEEEPREDIMSKVDSTYIDIVEDETDNNGIYG